MWTPLDFLGLINLPGQITDFMISRREKKKAERELFADRVNAVKDGKLVVSDSCGRDVYAPTGERCKVEKSKDCEGVKITNISNGKVLYDTLSLYQGMEFIKTLKAHMAAGFPCFSELHNDGNDRNREECYEVYDIDDIRKHGVVFGTKYCISIRNNNPYDKNLFEYCYDRYLYYKADLYEGIYTPIEKHYPKLAERTGLGKHLCEIPSEEARYWMWAQQSKSSLWHIKNEESEFKKECEKYTFLKNEKELKSLLNSLPDEYIMRRDAEDLFPKDPRKDFHDKLYFLKNYKFIYYLGLNEEMEHHSPDAIYFIREKCFYKAYSFQTDLLDKIFREYPNIKKDLEFSDKFGVECYRI